MPGKAKLLFAGNKRPVWRSLRWDKEVFGGDYGLDLLPKQTCSVSVEFVKIICPYFNT